MTTPPPPIAPVALPIALCALAAFATGTGMRALDPLLPVLAQDFAVDVAALSAAVAGFSLSYGLVQLVAGPVGDRFGKPRVATAALLLFAVSVAAGAAANSLSALVGLRVLAGLFGGAVIPLVIAHLADSIPYAERQAALGRFLTGMVMAQLLTGPVVGLIAEAAGWRAGFLALGAFAGVAALAMAVRIGPALWRDPGGGARGRGLAAYVELLARPAGRRLLLLAFCNGVCLFGGAFPFVGAFVAEEFDQSPGRAGLVVAAFGLGALAYTRLAPRLLARLGERGMLSWGGSALCVGIAGLALAPSVGVVVAVQAGLGLAFFTFHGVLQTRATEALPEARGTAVSAFALALFSGQTLGALLFGALLPVAGYRGGFLAAAAGVAVLTVYAVRRRRPA